ncbi:MAG: tyrosine-type recombinase/integrase [Bacteroidia bacterium]|nr:tyrosine-type recombinase/integrase [Bacteroidia bacterium]
MSIQSFKAYLELEKNYSPHTVLAYEKDLLSFQDFCRDTHSLEEISQSSYPMIRSWLVSLVEGGLTNRSVNRKVSSLKAYYKFLMRIGELEHNPLVHHKSLKTAKKVEIPFSEQEMRALMDPDFFESDWEGVRNRLMIEMLYATGMRRAELINLKITDVDLNIGTIKVLGKRNKERILPLLPSLRENLMKYLKARQELEVIKDPSILFLTLRGAKMYDTLVYRVINSYFSKISSKTKKSPHILRHTFATHLLAKGADLNSVKELLGHSSLASTQVYTHNSIAELKKVHSASHPRNKSD